MHTREERRNDMKATAVWRDELLRKEKKKPEGKDKDNARHEHERGGPYRFQVTFYYGRWGLRIGTHATKLIMNGNVFR
jgi:hypothetical protein